MFGMEQFNYGEVRTNHAYAHNTHTHTHTNNTENGKNTPRVQYSKICTQDKLRVLHKYKLVTGNMHSTNNCCLMCQLRICDAAIGSS